MAIKSYEKDGKTFYIVDVRIRSTLDPEKRVQKRERGFTSLKEAEAAEKRLREQAMRQLIRVEKYSCSWRSLVDEWQKAMHEGIGAAKSTKTGTSLSYIQAIEDFTEAWMERPASEITTADVEEIFTSMTREGYSNCRQYNVRTAINSVFKWGIKKRLLKEMSESPAYGIKISRKESKKPEILNLTQIRKLLDEARLINHPWFHIWAVALHSGMRSGELHALRWSCVDFETKRIKVETAYSFREKRDDSTKGGYWREVPINSELERVLIELRAVNNGNGHVLPRIKEWDRGEAARVIRSFCESIGVTSICFHTLRACWATQLLRQSVAPIIVMKMGGWVELKVMQRYIRFAGLEISGATDSLELLGPEKKLAQVVSLFGD